MSARVRIVTLTAVLVLGSSCGQRGQPDSPPPGGGNGPGIDWSDALNGNGVEVPSLDAAQSQLTFTIVPPGKALGDPSSIQVSDPKQFAPADRALGLVYQGGAFGFFVVIEGRTEYTQEFLESLPASCDESDACEGESLIKLADGSTALLLSGAPVTSVTWLDDGIEIEVKGPAGSLTDQEAIGASNAFVS